MPLDNFARGRTEVQLLLDGQRVAEPDQQLQTATAVLLVRQLPRRHRLAPPTCLHAARPLGRNTLPYPIYGLAVARAYLAYIDIRPCLQAPHCGARQVAVAIQLHPLGIQQRPAVQLVDAACLVGQQVGGRDLLDVDHCHR